MTTPAVPIYLSMPVGPETTLSIRIDGAVGPKEARITQDAMKLFMETIYTDLRASETS